MKKNIFYWIISALILGLIVGLPFLFTKSNEAINATNEVLVPYIIAKVLFGLAFCYAIYFGAKNKIGTGNIYIFFVATLIVQAIPGFARLGANLSSFRLGFEILLIVLSLIAYLAFTALLLKSNEKQQEAMEKYKASEIPLQDEKELENKNLR